MSKRGWFIGLVALALAGLVGIGGYYLGERQPGEIWRGGPAAPARGAGEPTSSNGRLALVIGNDKYTGEAVLTNAVNDAEAMRKLLKQAGFDLMENGNTDNTSRQTLADLTTDFGRKLRESGGVGVFYYSGHGMQVGGKNYLIPVDAQIRDEHDLPSRAVPLESVLNQMDGRGAGAVNLVILDACRVNPFPWIRGGVRGLAQEPTPDSTLILYAAKPGTAASDNVRGRNGLFTHHLVQALSQPGAKVQDALDQVAKAVYRESEQKQTPWKEGLLLTPFVLIPAEPTPPPPVTTGGIDEDAMACEALKTSVKPAAFKAYLGRFEKGRCAGFAEVRLAELESPSVRSEPPLAVPVPLPSVVVPPPVVETPPVVSPAMVSIKGGLFRMGSRTSETRRDSDEAQHDMSVKDFELGQTEVTVGEFQRFVDATGYRTDAEKNAGDKEGCYIAYREGSEWKFGYRAGYSWKTPPFKQSDDHPVVCVSWNDAQAYVKWLSQQTGQTYRLPTEAEWEYAARAGTTTVRYWGDDPDQTCQYANVYDQSSKRANGFGWEAHSCDDGWVQTAPVGRFKPNGWKLYDMLGNVWEWTCSAYAKDYDGSEVKCTDIDTFGPLAVRGGGWDDLPVWVRSASRLRLVPTDRNLYLGFRLARSL